MKNILFVASDNSAVSGAFLCLTKLCEELKKYNINPIVVIPYDGDGGKLLDKAGIKTYRVDSYSWTIPQKPPNTRFYLGAIRRLVWNRKAIDEIRKIIRAEKIDLIHINTSWTYVGAAAAKKEGIPYVWHFRELLKEGQNRRILFKRQGYSLIRGAEKIVAVSQYVYDHIKKDIKCRDNQLVVIPEGLDENQYCCQRSILNKKAVNILDVGRLNEEKGQIQLVKAAKLLSDRHYKIEIVGSDEGDEGYADFLKEIAKKDGTANEIIFCGKTDNTTQYYNKADIFVMSATADAFGRTTVEAMMAGCLVIGANAGATPELLNNGEYGFLYEPYDSADLAEKIKYVINNRQRAREIATAGQRYALENFTAAINAENVANLYKSIRHNAGD